jgi:uncharacterized membrane protein
LHDVLFVLLIFLAGTLLAEELIPGIISEHIGLSKIVILIALNIFLISTIYPHIENNLKKDLPTANKKTLLAVSLFGILLLINSFLKISFLLNALLVLQVGIITYILYSIFFKK